MAAARGAGMAVACVSAIALSAGGMYASALDSKAKEGPSSMHKTAQWPAGSDKNMGTVEVADALKVPLPGDRRRRLRRDTAARERP
ncbi:hypothetical protein FISHEDRAFT_76513 [Fistulina hepatica ATCC 64428]|uniref:Uncharacterized protein n=1 Tax=Fistulina hepatica ATCC 64428 TaxID=1128425 RepID=A0A0D7A4D0_9AGAR|nr:hypothetical protein FISHEDRAFT_76513 [Fistulina hepatica ATCC 64428]